MIGLLLVSPGSCRNSRVVSVLPKMAGVFEVEVDGVEHDHGHHDEAAQVTAAPRF